MEITRAKQPDTIILHLPFPPSANRGTTVGKNKRTGALIFYHHPEKRKFLKEADELFLTQKRGLGSVRGPFSYHLILNEKHRHGNADGDNRMKYALDYAQRVGVIENDKHAIGGSWAWGSCEFGALLAIRSATYPSNVDPGVSK